MHILLFNVKSVPAHSQHRLPGKAPDEYQRRYWLLPEVLTAVVSDEKTEGLGVEWRIIP